MGKLMKDGVEYGGGSIPQPMQPVKKVLWSGTLSAGQSVTLDEDITQYLPFIGATLSNGIETPFLADTSGTTSFPLYFSATIGSATTVLYTYYAYCTFVKATRLFTVITCGSFQHTANSNHGGFTAIPFSKLYAVENQIKAGPIPMDLLKQEILNDTYPVGCTYQSFLPDMPANIAALGTWRRLEGVMIAAASDTDPDFSFSDEVRGAEKVSLTANQNGQHSHSIAALSAFNSGGQSQTHAHSSPVHAHAAPVHTHVVSGSTGGGRYTEGAGGHSHGIYRNSSFQSGSNIQGPSIGGTLSASTITGTVADHTHAIPSVLVTGTAANNAAANTGNNAAANTGNATVDHTHTIALPAHSTANSGTGEAHENMPPYITRYMWERIA